jgi:hypothetical protein
LETLIGVRPGDQAIQLTRGGLRALLAQFKQPFSVASALLR